jgi:predicted O-methyltransferase YrrM
VAKRVPGEQPTNLVNVARYAFAHPKKALVMAGKVLKRVKESHDSYDPEDNREWIKQEASSSAELAARLDPALWAEAVEFGRVTRERAAPILAAVPFDMGAGGDYEFLYWLTRYRRPSTIVETGVSSGWTSQAFLKAIEKNGVGRLYSSDFPYFRVKDPETYIGLLVEPSLKQHWTLYTEGDQVALPKIMSQIESLDVFHYDSDKSRSGRAFGVEMAQSRLAPDGIILMDDLADDSWFREYVEANQPPYAVLNGRFGLIGEVTPPTR